MDTEISFTLDLDKTKAWGVCRVCRVKSVSIIRRGLCQKNADSLQVYKNKSCRPVMEREKKGRTKEKEKENREKRLIGRKEKREREREKEKR